MPKAVNNHKLFIIVWAHRVSLAQMIGPCPSGTTRAALRRPHVERCGTTVAFRCPMKLKRCCGFLVPSSQGLYHIIRKKMKEMYI